MTVLSRNSQDFSINVKERQSVSPEVERFHNVLPIVNTMHKGIATAMRWMHVLRYIEFQNSTGNKPTQKDIIFLTRLSQNNVSLALKNLIEANLVDVEIDEPYRRYSLNVSSFEAIKEFADNY